MAESSDVLRGPHVLEYPYKRSLGPVLSRFFTSLRDRQFEGIRARDGKVIVPPQEYDPHTGEALSEWVPVGPGGEIVSWSWVSKPRKKQPLQHPFAYALIQLDGADVPLLHAVDASVRIEARRRRARGAALGRRAEGRHRRRGLLRPGEEIETPCVNPSFVRLRF